MSNVIDFLQRLGQDAELSHATRQNLELALTEAGIDPASREVLLGSDQRELESLLGANTNVCAIVAAPRKKEEEDEEEEDDLEDDEDEDEDEDDDEDEFEDDDDEDDDEDEDEDEDDDYDEEEDSLSPRPLRRAA